MKGHQVQIVISTAMTQKPCVFHLKMVLLPFFDLFLDLELVTRTLNM